MISTLNIPIKISKKSVEQGSWPHNSYLVELASSNLKREREKKNEKTKKVQEKQNTSFHYLFLPCLQRFPQTINLLVDISI